MAWIFISYRRQDSEPFAIALRDELDRRFGIASAFLDTESIGYGTHFPASIEQALGEARVVLVLIGRRWLGAADPNGQSRLQHDSDWVRRELRDALEARISRGLRVIPVLLQDARMPAAADLPADLAGLTDLNGFVLASVPVDFPRLAEVIERRHPVLEPAVVMAIATGLGWAARAAQRGATRGPLGEFDPGSLTTTRWFFDLCGASLYYALLVLGVLLAVRSRTGWRTPETLRIVACAALGVAAMHTALMPVLTTLDWASTPGVRIGVWFTGAALGSAVGIDRYAPTFRISRVQWLRLCAAVVVAGVLGSLLQATFGEAVSSSGAWLRNPRTLFWGPVLLAFAATWQWNKSAEQPAQQRHVRWRVVLPVLLAMLAGDAIGVLTGPWLAGNPSPDGLRLLDAKDAWNHAIFFGLVAAVTAWRMNQVGQQADAVASSAARATVGTATGTR